MRDSFKKKYSTELGRMMWYQNTPGITINLEENDKKIDGGTSDNPGDKIHLKFIRDVLAVRSGNGSVATYDGDDIDIYNRLVHMLSLNYGCKPYTIKYYEQNDAAMDSECMHDILQCVDVAVDDKDLFTRMKEIYVELGIKRTKKENIDYMTNRGIKLKDLVPIKGANDATKYLDIGTFDGTLTASIANAYGIHKNNTYGADIKKNDNIKDMGINFGLIKGQRLPFKNNTFGIITCLMVLHHVPKKILNLFLREIYRVMKKGGILILREHDNNMKEIHTRENFTRLLDLLHDLYDHVWAPENSWLDTCSGDSGVVATTNYMSYSWLKRKLLNIGFVDNPDMKYKYGSHRGRGKSKFKHYVNSYMESFIKK